MKKDFIIIAATVVVVSLGAYSAIWLVKTSLFKSQISEFVSSKSDQISVGEITSSGFPFAQKITVKDLKFFDESASINFKKIEASTSALSSTYFVKAVEAINIDDPAQNISVSLELNPSDKIIIETSDQQISHIKFLSSGFKILDKISNRKILSAEYKNAESEVVLGEAISYKHKNLGMKILDEAGNISFSSAAVALDLAIAEEESGKKLINVELDVKDFEYANLHNLYSKINGGVMPSTEVASANNKVGGKNNLLISAQALLTKNSGKVVKAPPVEAMTKITNELKKPPKPANPPYSIALNIRNFEFASALYKIVVTGDVNTSEEDTIPSGALSVKLENVDHLANSVSETINRFEENSQKEEKQKTLNSVVAILKNLGEKNSRSVDNSPVFDIERAKNDGVNFMVNNVTFFEIMLRFMQQDGGMTSSKNQPTVSVKKLTIHN